MSEYFRLDKYKSELELLFPTAFLDDNWELLIQNHLVNQEFWRIQTLEIGLKRIKYLLICEAPPFSHVPFKYFYNGHASSLLTRVWKSFFPNTPIPRDLNKAYLALSSQGFLLVDSLPFALPYKTDIRKKSAYLSLISQYLADWTKAINDNFIVGVSEDAYLFCLLTINLAAKLFFKPGYIRVAGKHVERIIDVANVN